MEILAALEKQLRKSENLFDDLKSCIESGTNYYETFFRKFR